MIGAGLLGFGTRIAQQIDKTGNTIGGWFDGGEDVFGDGSSNQPEIAFAVYSADDNSLDFYKRTEVPEVGDKFEFKTVTEVYTGFETGTYTLVETPTDRYGSSTAPWAAHSRKGRTCDRSRQIDTSLYGPLGSPFRELQTSSGIPWEGLIRTVVKHLVLTTGKSKAGFEAQKERPPSLRR